MTDFDRARDEAANAVAADNNRDTNVYWASVHAANWSRDYWIAKAEEILVKALKNYNWESSDDEEFALSLIEQWTELTKENKP